MGELEPIELRWERGCAFKKKPKKGTVQPRGCARCGGNKGDRIHMGAPPSLNVLGSGDPGHFQNLKHQWTGLLAVLLEASALPRGLARITVEGQVTFPDRGRRDQGNYRVLLEKAFGDTLVNGWWERVNVSKVQPGDVTRPTKNPKYVEVQRIVGGWLEDDDWSRYEFGGLAYRYEKGVSACRLMLFPLEADESVMAEVEAAGPPVGTDPLALFG